LRSIAADPDEVRKMGVAAQRHVAENFSLDAVSRRWATLYTEVLKQHGVKNRSSPIQNTVEEDATSERIR
jgi:hypothetical protein